MKKEKSYKERIFFLVSPVLAYFISYSTSFAAVCNIGAAANNKSPLNALVTTLIGCFLTPIAYLLVSSSIVIFTFGVFKFIRAEGDDKQSGREFMFWGIVALFVMVSLWGLVNVLQNTFQLQL